MSITLGFRSFKKTFFKPRVFIFVLFGVGFMFLTFFTYNNALELGISGIASIFIGIGVNNYTAIETEQKDELRMQVKIKRAVKALHHIQGKLKKIEQVNGTESPVVEIEVNEMNDYIDLCILYLEEM